jgi:hypothetical protein
VAESASTDAEKAIRQLLKSDGTTSAKADLQSATRKIVVRKEVTGIGWTALYDKPYTKQDFFESKGYFPTIAAITLDKAIFGDKSDCIEPIMTKKNKIYKDSTDFIKALIKEISKSDVTLKDVEKVIDYSQNVELLGKMEKTHVEDIIALISISSNALDALKNNIRLIKCRCDDVTKHIKCHAVNPSYNHLIEATLERNKSNKQKFHFGNIS